MTARLFGLLPLLLSALLAQDRRPLLGLLVDGRGEPVAAAAVTCVYASPGDPSFLHDEQSATTDERGRFRCELWNGVSYAVWAIGPAADGGERLVTGLHYGATGGGYLEVATRGEQAPRMLAIDGLEPWLRRGASSLRLHHGGKDLLGLPLTLPGEDGHVALPPTPMTELVLVVRDGEQSVLVMATVDARGAQPRALLPAPVERVVQVADGGSLPAGARVHVRMQVPQAWDDGELFGASGPWLAGRSHALGADGRCRVLVPAVREDPNNRWLRSIALVAMHESQPRAVEIVAATPQEDDYCKERLGQGGEVQLRPLPAAPLRASLPRAYAAGPGEVLLLPRRGADSTYFDLALPQVVTGQRLAQGVACGEAWAGLEVWGRAAVGEPGPALPCLAFASGARRGQPPAPAIGLETVVVTVRDPDAGPARDAWVCIEPLDGAYFGGRTSAERWQRADSGGRVVRRLAPGDYGAHATDGAALGVTRIAVTEGQQAAARLDLEPLPTLSCRVLGPDGKPSAGAQVWTMVYGDPPGGDDALVRQHFQIVLSLAYRLTVRTVTDANGEITFPVIPLVSRGEHCSLAFRRADGSRTDRVPMRPGVEFVEVR